MQISQRPTQLKSQRGDHSGVHVLLHPILPYTPGYNLQGGTLADIERFGAGGPFQSVAGACKIWTIRVEGGVWDSGV